MNITESLLQKLKNKAQNSGLSFQLTLQLFCQEEFLRRLGYSKFQQAYFKRWSISLYNYKF